VVTASQYGDLDGPTEFRETALNDFFDLNG
jgi:hypothetical protein